MSVLSTDEAFILDVFLETPQATQRPNALIRSLAEQLIEARKELAATKEELAALQLRAADNELEILLLRKLTSTLSEQAEAADQEDPY